MDITQGLVEISVLYLWYNGATWRLNMNKKSPIGIFDSGFGGISVVKELVSVLPHEDILFFGDSKYNPYGTKDKEEVVQRCTYISNTFMKQDVKAIVIACNTATSVCVKDLRQKYPIDIIGMEPALKVACDQGKKQKIAVWATPLTLKEKKFKNLMEHFKDEHTIYSIPCPKLVSLVEENRLDQIELVKEVLQEYVNQASDVDSIVLGCTHFVFFKEILETMLLDKVKIIDGNQGTIQHLKDVLAQKDLLNDQNEQGKITWYNSDPDKLSLSQILFER